MLVPVTRPQTESKSHVVLEGVRGQMGPTIWLALTLLGMVLGHCMLFLSYRRYLSTLQFPWPPSSAHGLISQIRVSQTFFL
jgi:hypothetical protein